MAPPQTQRWQVGSVVAQYTLVEELARGGMGEIWLARQPMGRTERLVVLKRVLTTAKDAAATSMFLDEARIASMLHHPNIVQVFDLREENGALFLVMEYLQGLTLSRLMRKLVVEQGGVVPEAVAVEIISGAARGLGYAHRRARSDGSSMQIVHRDVAPQNLFLTWEGEAKVLDFGIARATGRLVRTMTGVIKGRISYMSPEQARGDGTVVTGAADVYSLGVLLFEAVTGTRLYAGLDDGPILERLVLEKPAPRASSRRPLDPQLDDLISRALSVDPARRFADGQVFHEALEAWRQAHGAAMPQLRERLAELFPRESAPRVRGAVSAPSLVTPTAVDGPTEATKADRPRGRPQTTPGNKAVARAAPLPIATRTELVDSPSAPRSTSRALLWGSVAAITLVGGVGVALVLASREEPLEAVAKNGDAKTGDAKTGDAKTGDAKTGDAKTGDAKTGDAKTGDPKTGDPKTGDPKTGDPKTGDPKTGDPKTGDPKTGDPKTGDPKLRDPRRSNTTTDPTGDKRAATQKVGAGLLTLDTEPWTRVMLGKTSLGETPLIDLALPAGVHRLRLINEDDKVDTVIEVTIRADETTRKKLDLK